MNKYPKAKRNQVIVIVMVTLAIMVGLWFGLISPQQDSLRRMKERRLAADKQLSEVVKAIQDSARIQADLQEVGKKLGELEDGMAGGDLYAWAINTIREFKLPYKVEIPQFSQIDGPRPTSILPNFPYKEAVLTIGGTGFYNDLGQFVADFENTFPHIRIQNLTVEPVPTLTGSDREKLSFKMDIVMLVKPTAT